MNTSGIIEAYKQAFYSENIKKPLMVSIDITSSCNLNCAHCYNKKRSVFDYINSNNKATSIVQKLEELQIMEVTLCGGEPLLSPYFREILSDIKKRGISIRLITNGLLIDKHLDFLCEQLTDDDWIQVSIDEALETVGSQRYPTTQLKKIAYENLQKISSRFGNVIVNITPTKLNQAEIQTIFENAISFGAKHIGATPYIPIGGISADEIIPDYGYLGELEYKLINYCDAMGITYWGGISGHPCQQEVHSALQNRMDNPIKLTPMHNPVRHCDAGCFSFHVANDGTIYPCAFMQSNDFSITHIMYSSDKILDDFVKFSKMSNIPMPNICCNCDIFSECQGGCMGLINDRYRDLQQVDPRCKIKNKHSHLEANKHT